MEHFFPEPQNLLLHPRQIVYFGSKGTLPREFFKFMVSGRLAPGFNFAIFDDFSKKHKGGPLFSKKSVEKSRKIFLEITSKSSSPPIFEWFCGGGHPFFSEVAQASPPPLKWVFSCFLKIFECFQA